MDSIRFIEADLEHVLGPTSLPRSDVWGGTEIYVTVVRPYWAVGAIYWNISPAGIKVVASRRPEPLFITSSWNKIIHANYTYLLESEPLALGSVSITKEENYTCHVNVSLNEDNWITTAWYRCPVTVISERYSRKTLATVRLTLMLTIKATWLCTCTASPDLVQSFM